MPKNRNEIPEERIRHALEQLDEILPRAIAASNAVDSLLGFLLNHRMDHVPQFTLLKESGTHYRHLAELFCPAAREAIRELLPDSHVKRPVRRTSPKAK